MNLTELDIYSHFLVQNKILNGADFKVYIYLFLEALNKEDVVLYRSYSVIEKACRLSRPTVIKAVQSLLERKLIHVKSNTTHENSYEIDFLSNYNNDVLISSFDELISYIVSQESLKYAVIHRGKVIALSKSEKEASEEQDSFRKIASNLKIINFIDYQVDLKLTSSYATVLKYRKDERTWGWYFTFQKWLKMDKYKVLLKKIKDSEVEEVLKWLDDSDHYW